MSYLVDVTLRCHVAASEKPDLAELKGEFQVQAGIDHPELVVVSHAVVGVDNLQEVEPDWSIPLGLSTQGLMAAATIYNFLEERGARYSGGCKVFYSPQEWLARGEDYCHDAELVVVYDGGDHAPYFGLDHCRYDLHDSMAAELGKIGLYAEQGTCWYSAIYKA